MKYQDLDYDIDKSQKYLIVRGTALSTAPGASYLWWLNGKNKGTQVEPTIKKTIAVGSQAQTLIAWDITESGLYDNFTGDRPSLCMGQTIFGLTSTNSDGTCEIHDINFVENIDNYIATTPITPPMQTPPTHHDTYNLHGIRLPQPHKGIYIKNKKKIIK